MTRVCVRREPLSNILKMRVEAPSQCSKKGPPQTDQQIFKRPWTGKQNGRILRRGASLRATSWPRRVRFWGHYYGKQKHRGQPWPLRTQKTEERRPKYGKPSSGGERNAPSGTLQGRGRDGGNLITRGQRRVQEKTIESLLILCSICWGGVFGGIKKSREEGGGGKEGAVAKNRRRSGVKS